MFIFAGSIMTMKTTYKIFALIFSIILAAGCSKDNWEEEFIFSGGHVSTPSTERQEMDVKETEPRVLLMYAAGHNNLGYTPSYIPKNIKDLTENWLPHQGSNDNILLIYSHLADYPIKPTESHLVRVYKNYRGSIVSDTLVTYDQTAISASAQQLNRVLTDVKDLFDAESYGMIFSSHATGYLPAGYSSSYVFQEHAARNRSMSPTFTDYVEREPDPRGIMVKSIGQDKEGTRSYEMNLPEFAEAIPMKLDYIIFDACFMGGIEVAYELKDKCDRIAFSQAEIVADGFYYPTLAQRLLGGDSPDLTGACEDYFDLYKDQYGWKRSATVSLVNCNKLQQLSETCKTLFEKHRTSIRALVDTFYESDDFFHEESFKVQQFQRDSYEDFHFYDLESVIKEAGASTEEIQDLQADINNCIIYKACTEKILDEVDIHTFSGFSMYLPGMGTSELEKFYRTLAWNKAAELIK